ncbi:MAG: glycosyltransferase [Crocinitomicaceae bacterium]
MKDKKRILICIDWYEPGFKAGGPIRSVANIVNALKDVYEFYILTSAYDLGTDEPYEGITLNEWFDREGVFIKYLERNSLNRSVIRRNILEIDPDTLYLNSLFSKHFTLYPLMTAKSNKIPVVLAPRGMLGAGALDIKKGKKKTFLLISRLTGLYGKVKWHASTIEEKHEIKKMFGKNANVYVAQNISVTQKISLDDILKKKKTGNIRIIYVSRISIKKNLHLAIQAFKQIKFNKQIAFDIFGNIEDTDYWQQIKEEIGEFGQLKISYKGVVRPSDLPAVYASADYLILPTKHENYGHVIVEAWAHGCPVIISRNTPWKNLNVQNLGWDVDLKNFDNLVKALQEAVDLDFTSYIAQVTACYKYFREVISDQEVIEANRKLFEDE